MAGWESTGALLYLTFFLTLQAEAELHAGHSEDAARLLTRALQVATTSGESFYEPAIHRLLGDVALGQQRVRRPGCSSAPG